MGWYVPVPPQDETLVFCDRDAADLLFTNGCNFLLD